MKQLLQQGREAELTGLVMANPSSLPLLVGRLWDTSPQVQDLAARVMGAVAASHRSLGREIVRRLRWALNDESTTNGVYGLAGLREIGRREPGLLAPHVPALVDMAWDRGLRLELLRTLTALAESAPEIVEPQVEVLRQFIDPTVTSEREAFDRLVDTLPGAADDTD